jgi:hypothetical protein
MNVKSIGIATPGRSFQTQCDQYPNGTSLIVTLQRLAGQESSREVLLCELWHLVNALAIA